jgi:hypothetical protein
MVLLSQGAPQCAPPPTPAPTVSYRDVTASLPPDLFASDISNDGRFVGYGGITGGAWRLDVQTGQVVPNDGGILIGDGTGVVDGASDTAAALYDFVTGAELARVELPAGWQLASIDSASHDGYLIGVTAVNGAEADTAAFVLDLRRASARRLDAGLPGSALTATSSYHAVLSADGSITAFSYQDGPVGCAACVDVWVLRPITTAGGAEGDLGLVSATSTGGTSATGDSEPIDLSADGRFVLFHTTATDVVGAGGPPAFEGRLVVHDMNTGAAWSVPGLGALGDVFSSAISDDGNKVAFPTVRDSNGGGPRPFAALYDRSSGTVTALSPVDLDHQLSWSSWLAMNGSGTRVAFDVTTNPGVVQHAIVDVTY